MIIRYSKHGKAFSDFRLRETIQEYSIKGEMKFRISPQRLQSMLIEELGMDDETSKDAQVTK